MSTRSGRAGGARVGQHPSPVGPHLHRARLDRRRPGRQLGASSARSTRSSTRPPPVDTAKSPAFFWLVGRYLADGWRVDPTARAGSSSPPAHTRRTRSSERIREVYPCTPRARADRGQAAHHRARAVRLAGRLRARCRRQADPGLAVRHRPRTGGRAPARRVCDRRRAPVAGGLEGHHHQSPPWPRAAGR